MDIKQFIENHLPVMDSPEKVYELFKGLGYKILDTSYRGIEAWGLRERDKEAVKEIYTIANYDKRFQIYLVVLKSFASSIVRDLPAYFERETQYPFFVLTPDFQHYTFVLIEKIREDAGVWKRKTIKLNLDRENAYHTDKWVVSNMSLEDRESEPSQIYKHLKEAMSVEKVGNLFFKDYQTHFFEIRKNILKQRVNIKEAHEFAQQLLNRIMFIYFIDKKRWLKHSPGFMKWFWNKYCEQKKKKGYTDEFYSKWLKVLFHQAFNNRFGHPQYMPQEVRDTLALAPYLNGGLFKENDLDGLSVALDDEFMARVLKFFNKYNFTIREDLPLDVEVAVDPQMIGYVYESLANVAEEIYERQDLGIFYTPRIEVDFMCRRSLLEYLSKNTDLTRERLYHLLFDDDKAKIEKLLNEKNFIDLEEALDNLAVIDPACGSGAFLVGMLNILVEIYKLIFKHLNREMTDYQLKKRIIGKTSYGVDVMPWAVHSAELRLWLSLMIESDLTIGELKVYPLLPNLNLKLRVGDSLVQELGGINLNLRNIYLSQSIKRKLNELKEEKEKYYNIDPTAKFKTERAILTEEQRLFQQIINERIIELSKKKQALIGEKGAQFEIFKREKTQEEIFDEKSLKEMIAKEKVKIENEIALLNRIVEKIQEKKPFVWDIDFAEIFGEKGGFDIVIGNPPYVRQEKIAPPGKLKSEITNEQKKEYKDKLLKSIQNQLPQVMKIDKKSDLYIYFYFHSLSLLNERGTFCFITSNSWLDVGYGKNLQEFLLKYVPIVAIYDNQAKRSFEHADVNTIIALFSSPLIEEGKGEGIPQNNLAKFVMFKKPFEEVINTDTLLRIENIDTMLITDDFRVYAKKHIDLLEAGWEFPEEIQEEQKEKFKFHIGTYAGDKWNGKYLRAPDIFFTILEKGKDKMARLDDIANVRRGFTTGCNEFFYLPSKYFDIKKEGKYYNLIPTREGLPNELKIEEEYLVPVIKTPKECASILVKSSALNTKVFVCQKSLHSLSGTSVIEYIKWGSKQKTKGRQKQKAGIKWNDVATVESRKYWYSLNLKNLPDFFCNRFFNDRFFFSYGANVVEDQTFYGGIYKEFIENKKAQLGILNSTISALFTELLGRVALGEGVLQYAVYEMQRLYTITTVNLPKDYCGGLEHVLDILAPRAVHSIFQELGINPNQPIRSQNPNPLPDRKALDDIVFDILGLTQAERDEVYWSVCELVKNRLEKARSL